MEFGVAIAAVILFALIVAIVAGSVGARVLIRAAEGRSRQGVTAGDR